MKTRNKQSKGMIIIISDHQSTHHPSAHSMNVRTVQLMIRHAITTVESPTTTTPINNRTVNVIVRPLHIHRQVKKIINVSRKQNHLSTN